MKKFNVNDIKPVVERLLQLDNVNPVDVVDGNCMYVDPENPNRHCIAGQLCVELGVPLPRDNRQWQRTSSSDHFTCTANEMITALQRHADGVDLPAWNQIDINLDDYVD